jgi:dipeptidyl aminopeptidase/acylaminoacyl peptidase
MIVEIICILLLLVLPGWLRFFGGLDSLFYQPRRNAIPVESTSFKPISTKTSDGVTIRGFEIHPQSTNSNKVMLYFHGIMFNPQYKLASLKEQAQRYNVVIVVFNYRGYSYSDD